MVPLLSFCQTEVCRKRPVFPSDDHVKLSYPEGECGLSRELEASYAYVLAINCFFNSKNLRIGNF